SNLLRKRKIDEQIVLSCKCGYQQELENDNRNIEKTIRKKNRALEKNLLIVSDEDKISIHPKTKKDCPKCGNLEAETWQVQIRSSDEPSTHFFKCTSCKYTWREQ
ncbi:MAG: RPA12/RPB9/RPC11 RNA polymerase family protein, partial [Promethearchaeota archaeon]